MDSVTLKQLYDKACKGKYGCEYFKIYIYILLHLSAIKKHIRAMKRNTLKYWMKPLKTESVLLL
jgi:cytochrome b561